MPKPLFLLVLGLLLGVVLAYVNRVILNVVFSLTILGFHFHFHHFFYAMVCLGLGVFSVWKREFLPAYLLFPVGFVLLLDDFSDFTVTLSMLHIFTVAKMTGGAT